MKQVLLKQGKACVAEVPCPKVDTGYVLVKVEYSCISAGTEMSGLKMSGAPLWKRALQQPENVKKTLNMLMSSGFSHTKSVVQGKLAAGSATGYSAAGKIIGLGDDIQDLKIGDAVACAGAEHAHHAEVISVPRNLVVPVPAQVTLPHAATVTLGAIALQGIRRAQPTLGETFVVVGLGILGQLTAQLLKLNGCSVIGIDLDPTRVELAKSLGMDVGLLPEIDSEIETVFRLTHGVGADGVIITAASSSDQIIATAFNMCRKKGRVVLVGDVGLHLKRHDIYQKELDFFISTSYGPGRYDNRYENEGLDYPVAYVRWTENRNMRAYLDLLASDKLQIAALISDVVHVDHAASAYASLQSAEPKPMMVILHYPHSFQMEDHFKVHNTAVQKLKNHKINLAIVGAGSFAKSMHLPNIEKLTQAYHIQAIVSKSAHNAFATAKQFNASYGTCDYQQVLTDPNIDAVLITTRHHSHAKLALHALEAGKHVFVEKPLALSFEELQSLLNFYAFPEAESLPVLMTGFNRRFSKYMTQIKEIVATRTNPMIMTYRLNAGYIPNDHWVHQPEGGGRNIGEACHIYDLFTFLTDSLTTSVHATSITPATDYYRSNDNFVATIKFADGSVATLTYTALGNTQYPKEQLDIYVDGKVIVLNDYKSLKIFGKKTKEWKSNSISKGQMEEMVVFAHCLQNGTWPIPLWQQKQATEIAFQVEQLLRGQS